MGFLLNTSLLSHVLALPPVYTSVTSSTIVNIVLHYSYLAICFSTTSSLYFIHKTKTFISLNISCVHCAKNPKNFLIIEKKHLSLSELVGYHTQNQV